MMSDVFRGNSFLTEEALQNAIKNDDDDVPRDRVRRRSSNSNNRNGNQEGKAKRIQNQKGGNKTVNPKRGCSPVQPSNVDQCSDAADEILVIGTPFNSRNTLLSEKDVTRLLTRYGVRDSIKDLGIYRKSMVHKSYCTRKNENFLEGNEECPEDCVPLQEFSNERLEFLGDAVLNLIVGHYLYERFPEENEGFLTRIRTRIVNGQMLARLSKSVGFPEHMIISKQVEESMPRAKNNKLLEDVFEAFIGAIYLDFDDIGGGFFNVNGKGFAVSRDWVVGVIETHIDFTELVAKDTNYKDYIIKYFQYNYNAVPSFEEVERNAEEGITVCVKNHIGVVIGIASAESKKQAEQLACKNAIREHCKNVDGDMIL